MILGFRSKELTIPVDCITIAELGAREEWRVNLRSLTSNGSYTGEAVLRFEVRIPAWRLQDLAADLVEPLPAPVSPGLRNGAQGEPATPRLTRVHETPESEGTTCKHCGMHIWKDDAGFWTDDAPGPGDGIPDGEWTRMCLGGNRTHAGYHEP